jgi:asparagine synthase (glutamine-hydrolysing)
MALVSQIARRDVTVALSGDGGDEIFGGYNRYIWGKHLKRNVGLFPPVLKNIASEGIRLMSPSEWDRIFKLLPMSRQPRQVGEKLHKLATIMNANSPSEIYEYMTTFWADGLPLVGADEPPRGLGDAVWGLNRNFTEQMMLADTLSYLPDDILVKVDRASMAVGLEARSPFLDHRLFEFSWSLPLSYRVRGGQGKSLLRQVLYKHVTKDILERPKSGFALPIGDYLRGPLRDWAESLLNRERLLRDGFFNADKVRGVWNQHLSGKFNRQYDIWSILMFQAWLES